MKKLKCYLVFLILIFSFFVMAEDLYDDPYFACFPAKGSVPSRIEKAEYDKALKIVRKSLQHFIDASKNPKLYDNPAPEDSLSVLSKNAYVNLSIEQVTIEKQKEIMTSDIAGSFIDPISEDYPFQLMQLQTHMFLNPALDFKMRYQFFDCNVCFIPHYLLLKGCDPFFPVLEEASKMKFKDEGLYTMNVQFMFHLQEWPACMKAYDDRVYRGDATEWNKLLEKSKAKYDTFKILTYWYIRKDLPLAERTKALEEYRKNYDVFIFGEAELETKIPHIGVVFDLFQMHLSAIDAIEQLSAMKMDATFETRIAEVTYEIMNEYLKKNEIPAVNAKCPKTMKEARKWFKDIIENILSVRLELVRKQSVSGPYGVAPYRYFIRYIDDYTPYNKITNEKTLPVKKAKSP